jgi:hypothetical protein
VRKETRQAKAETRSASLPIMSKAQPMARREWKECRMRVVSFVGGSALMTERADLRSWGGVRNHDSVGEGGGFGTYVAGYLLREHVVVAFPGRGWQVVRVPGADAAGNCQSLDVVEEDGMPT